MLEQEAKVSHTSPSLEDIRQKRLAYFHSAQSFELPRHLPPDQLMKLLTPERESIVETSQDCQINNTSNSNNEHVNQLSMKHSDGSNRIHNDGGLPNSLPTSLKLIETSQTDGYQTEKFDNVNLLKSCDFENRDYLCYSSPSYMPEPDASGTSLTRVHYESQTDSRQRSIRGDSNSKATLGNQVPLVFSDETMSKMKSALSEQGLQNLMNKVAMNVRMGTITRQNMPELNGSETDITVETRGHSVRSSRSSSVESLDQRDRTSLRQSAHKLRRPRSQSPHKMTQVVTRDLLQLKEQETEVNKMVRNYSQETVTTKARNSFSADEIYRQAFGSCPDPSNQQHYTQRNLSSSFHHWSSKQEGTGSFQQNYNCQRGNDAVPQIFPSHAQHNFFMYPPPPHPAIESSYFSSALPSNPISSSGQYSQFPMQNGTQQFHNHLNQQPSSQYSQFPMQNGTQQFHNHLNQQPSSQHSPAYLYVPSSSSAAVQCSPSSFCYPPPPYFDSYGVPVFTNGIPLHLPPPPAYHHFSKPRYSFQPQIQPHPPLSERRDSLPTSGISNIQVVSDVLSTSEPVRIPHPPLIPPALNFKEEPIKHSPHSYYHREAQDEASSRYKLHRYFSSIELYNRNNSDFPGGVSQNSNQMMAFDYPQSMASSFTGGTGTSIEKAGGVTQRLQELNVDLEKLKHLRISGTQQQQEHMEAQGYCEMLKKVKYCPECNSTSKAYMDWCTKCGEMLIGIEPTLLKKNNKHISLEKSRKENSPRADRRSSITQEHKFQNSPHADTKSNIIQEDKFQNVQPYVTHTESETNENLLAESHKPFRGLSLSNLYAHHLGDIHYTREQRDINLETSDISNERNNCLQEEENHMEGKYVSQPPSEKDERCNQEDTVWVYNDDTDVNFLDEITDPVLKEFVSSYKRQKLLQQERNPNQNVIIREAAINTTNYGVSENATAVTDLHQGYWNSKMSKPSAVNPYSALAIPIPSRYEEEDSKMNDSSQTRLQALKITAGNIPVLEATTESKDQLISSPKAAETSLKLKHHKKKSKKHKGEMMDIEIFGYEEAKTTRNANQISNKIIVPVLNLSSEEDEAEEGGMDGADEDDGNSNLEDPGAKKAKNDTDMYMVAGDNSAADNPAKFQPAMKCQYSGRKQNMQVGRASRQYPFTVHKSPPPPATGRSEMPSHHRRGRGNVSFPGSYQRHWARSSKAWSLYNPWELGTRSSMNNPEHQKFGSRILVPARPNHGAESHQEVDPRYEHSGFPARQRPSSADQRQRRSSSESRQRPFSATTSSSSNLHTHVPTASLRNGLPAVRPNRYPATSCNGRDSAVVSVKNRPTSAKQKDLAQAAIPVAEVLPHPESTKNGEMGIDNDSPRLLCPEFHRLPQKEIEEVYTDRLHAVAKNAYDKFQEMTPRIAEGQVSRWQCLPDEIWLYIFNYLSQGDLIHLMQTCRYFYRLANDETLWKYITVKPRYSMTDMSLAAIAEHRPSSLAMVKCQGSNVTLNGLHHFFKETHGRLRELNICGCSQGSLVGSVMMSVASQYCKNLTHLDVSFCSVTDETFIAMSESADRLESVCLNGFQSLSDSTLLVLLIKHGKSLRTLELYACFLLSASAFHSIGKHCTSLRRLCLGSCNKLTDSAMTILSTFLSHIEELDLRGCKNLRNDCIRKIVRNCPHIHTLVLANCHQISDVALSEIATYLKNTLRALDVCGCNKISDGGVISLAKNCEQLVSVDISSTRCTSVSVNHLASNSCSRWLESVRLSFLPGMTEMCVLNLIHQCPRLKLMHVFGCSSLKNLAKLRSVNPKLVVEGDSDVTRSSLS